MPALLQLNAVTSRIFTGIGRSPVPVLLPFDTAAFLDARLKGAPASLSPSRYQADFSPADLFDAGPSGYDAVGDLQEKPTALRVEARCLEMPDAALASVPTAEVLPLAEIAARLNEVVGWAARRARA